MSLRTDTFDLGGLHLSAGEGRRLDLNVALEPLSLAGQSYQVAPEVVPVRLDVSRTSGHGYALRLRFEARVTGPCMRCLEAADPSFPVDAREISQPGGGEELTSPYVEEGELDLHAWSHDALALALPTQVLCRSECAGLCAVCGANLNQNQGDHSHPSGPDPRWAKLSELRLG